MKMSFIFTIVMVLSGIAVGYVYSYDPAFAIGTLGVIGFLILGLLVSQNEQK